MKISLKGHAGIFILLSVFLVVKLFFLFQPHIVIWDEAVYLGMGKYIFSLGKLGLWEHVRPVLFPMMLGFFWRISLDPVLAGRLLLSLFSLGIISLIYLIGANIFDRKSALLASIIFSFSPVFFFLGFHLYTEIPAVFFVLAALCLFLKKRFYLSGLMVGLAFLTKFPAALFLVCLIPFLKNYKKVHYLILGFLTAMVPFLIFNYFMYGSFLIPLLDARTVIAGVLGCNVLNYQPWYYYLIAIFKENFLYLFSVVGIILSIKRFDRKRGTLLLFLFLPLIYFMQLHCRDYRYLVLFLPFAALFMGCGLSFLVKKLDRRVFCMVAVFILLVSAYSGISSYLWLEPAPELDIVQDYYSYLEGMAVGREVWVSNPITSLYTSGKVNLVYYPVYDYSLAKSFHNYLLRNSSSIGYVFLDSCGGGIICPPGDVLCSEETSAFINYLHKNFRKVYDNKIGECYYYIFQEK